MPPTCIGLHLICFADCMKPKTPQTGKSPKAASASEISRSRSLLPLDGIRVVDFSVAMAGPLATQRLGDLGAEVIKIESPAGDLTRVFRLQGAEIAGETTSYLALNRNKRSLCIDLKTTQGRAVIRRVVRSADVIVQNFRPGVAERLGIGYRDLRRINRSVVYVSISGYGLAGPLAEAPGQDLLVQSFSGMTFHAGTSSDPPHPAPSYVVDACASHLATSATLAALFHRSRTGRGQHIRTSLLAAALELQCQEVMTFLHTGKMAQRGDTPSASVWLGPPYGIYRTADGWIALSQNDNSVIAEVVASTEMLALCQSAPEQTKATPEERVRWRDAVYRALQAKLLLGTTADWVHRLSARRVWCGAVNTLEEALAHEQTHPMLQSFRYANREVRGVGPVWEFSEAQKLAVAPPPRLGEHTRQILAEVGYSAKEISKLHKLKIVQ